LLAAFRTAGSVLCGSGAGHRSGAILNLFALENLEAAVALHFMWYNFGRVHQTLRVTPAMEAGVSDHVWTLDEVVGLLK